MFKPAYTVLPSQLTEQLNKRINEIKYSMHNHIKKICLIYVSLKKLSKWNSYDFHEISENDVICYIIVL